MSVKRPDQAITKIAPGAGPRLVLLLLVFAIALIASFKDSNHQSVEVPSSVKPSGNGVVALPGSAGPWAVNLENTSVIGSVGFAHSPESIDHAYREPKASYGDVKIRDRSYLQDAITRYEDQTSSESREKVLTALSRLNKPELNKDLLSIAYQAAAKDELALLEAVLSGVFNTESPEAVRGVRALMMATPEASDTIDVIAGSLSDLDGEHLIPELEPIIVDQYPGFSGAIAAMVNMGEPGVNALLEIAQTDASGLVHEQVVSTLANEDLDPEKLEIFLTMSVAAGYFEVEP